MKTRVSKEMRVKRYLLDSGFRIEDQIEQPMMTSDKAIAIEFEIKTEYSSTS